MSDIASNAEFSSASRASAVVVGGALNGLGVCRSLAAGGISVWVVDSKRSRPALWSRYAHPVLTDALHGPGFVTFLRDLQSRIGEPPFLIVTDELALLTVSEHREQLEGSYRFQLPAHDTVLMLHDKARFHESAVHHGWPVPNAVVVRAATDFPKLAALRLPVILKPADKRHFHAGHAPRLIVVDNRADLLPAAKRLLDQAGTVLVQETIEGPDDDIYFCLFYRGRGGETLGMFTGRKLASTPPGTGSTAFCAAAVNEELECTTKHFLDQVNYFGFGGIEFKRDGRNGRFLIIEPTVGRTDWQEEVATLAGVNIPVMAYRYEYNLPSPEARVDGRIIWQASWLERIRFGAKPIPPRSVVVDGYWRRGDPAPALVHYPHDVLAIAAVHASAWCSRLWRTARSRLSQIGAPARVSE